MAIDDQTTQLRKPRPAAAPIGDLPQATAQGAAAPRIGAAPGTPALPAPTLTVNPAGEAMSNAEMQRRAQMGLTPDVVRSQAARAISQPAPAPMAPAPSPLSSATTTLGAGGAPPIAAAAPTAPSSWATAPGAAGPEAVNPDVTVARQVRPPAATPNWTVGPQPAAAAPAAAQPNLATRAGQALSGTGDVLSRATRLGAQPVETVPGRFGPRTAPGQQGAAGAMLATTAALSAAESAGRDSSGYAQRFGVDETSRAPGGGIRDWLYDKTGAGTGVREGVENVAQFGRDAAMRVGGVMSDLGAAIPDSIVGMANATGATDIRPFASMYNDRAGDFKPNYATDQGGLSVRPGAVSEQGRAQNTQWETDTLRSQLAAREPGAGAAAAATPAAGAGPAVEPPQSLRPDRATSAATKDWSGAAQQAMNSTAPGTAVINGRVVSPQEIKALENRNVMSSSSMAPGVAYSAITGGGTMELGSGPTRGSRPQPGAGFIDREYSGGIGGPPTAAEQRAKETASLVSDIKTAIGSGKRRTAGALTQLLKAVTDRQGNELNAANAGRPRQMGAAEIALTNAQTGRAEADSTVAQLQAQQAQRAAVIQQQLQAETDPAKRRALQENLAAMEGRLPAAEAKKISRLKVPIGQGLDARDLELPYDEASNQLLLPGGLEQFLTQSNQPPKKK